MVECNVYVSYDIVFGSVYRNIFLGEIIVLKRNISSESRIWKIILNN